MAEIAPAAATKRGIDVGQVDTRVDTSGGFRSIVSIPTMTR
jgi:hypothetical protein